MPSECSSRHQHSRRRRPPRIYQVAVGSLWTIHVSSSLLVLFLLLSCHIDITNSLSINNNNNKRERRQQPKTSERKKERSGGNSNSNSNSNSNNSPKYITCSSSIELERAIRWFCKPTDTILEFGSQFSNVSLQILQTVTTKGGDDDAEGGGRVGGEQQQNGGGGGGGGGGGSANTGNAIFVDIEQQSTTTTSRRDGGNDDNNKSNKSGRCKHRNANLEVFTHDSCTIIKLPSLEEWKKTLFCFGENDDTTPDSIRHYDVIVIDVGHLVGNDLYMTTLTMANEMISFIEQSQQQQQQQQQLPRVVLIKSKSLSSLARRLIPCQRLLDGSYKTASITTSKSMPSSSSSTSTTTTSTAASNVADDGPIIISSVGVSEYRRTIPFVVQQGDSVIEVGCHYGRTTALLAEAVGAAGSAVVDNDDDDHHVTIRNNGGGICIGVDIGPKIIRRAQTVYPTLHFEVGDAWKTLDLLKFKFKYLKKEDGTNPVSNYLGYDVIYADIGGLSGAYGTLESLSLLDSLSNALQPRCIVIKSLCMRRLATKLVAFSNIWSSS